MSVQGYSLLATLLLAGVLLGIAQDFQPRLIPTIQPPFPVDKEEGVRVVITCLWTASVKLELRFAANSRAAGLIDIATKNGRYTILQDLQAPGGTNTTLVIDPAELTDSGEYFCLDRTSHTALSSSIVVLPRPPPVIQSTQITITKCSIYINKMQVIYEDLLELNATEVDPSAIGVDVVSPNTEYTLACRLQVTGAPLPDLNFQWLKNGILLPYNTSTTNSTSNGTHTITVSITLPAASTTEEINMLSASYHVYLNGTLDATDVPQIYPLRLYAAPAVRVSRPPSDQWEEFDGSTSQITCYVTRPIFQHGAVRINWMKDNIVLRRSSSHTVDPAYRNPEKPQETRKLLTIHSVGSGDGGVYVCSVSLDRRDSTVAARVQVSSGRLRVRDRNAPLYPFIGIILVLFVLAVILYADDFYMKKKKEQKGVDSVDGKEEDDEEEDQTDYPEDHDDKQLLVLLGRVTGARHRSEATPPGSNGASESRPLLSEQQSDSDLRQKLHTTTI